MAAPVASAPSRAVVLIGFMGAGKSTVAAELARALGVDALDSDELLEARLGHSIAEEFERRGEPSFRAQEEEVVCGLLASAKGGSVISLGGGSVLSARVREALEPHLVVLVDVDPEVAWERVGGSANGGRGGRQARPLAREREAFFALHAERRALYEQVADAHLPPLVRGSANKALDALRALAGAPRGTRLLWATSSAGEYPVVIGRGLLSAAPASRLVDLWPLDSSASRPFCVTDETVAALYGERLGHVAATITLPPGEQQKTLAGAERVWRALVAAGATRADHLVALGGGVVGDLAGFCAATYQRGVPVVHVPTTLVAQVDSAYGGKTGVDLAEAKNYVGAYHQPAGVIVDPDTLSTLPAQELAAGWVEVLKTALIAGGELWAGVARGEEVDERTIIACARTKLSIVAADERDRGRRMELNLGHTVGHAIEAATGYARYRHGEAVGLGLLAALRLSGQEALRGTVLELLRNRGLPVKVEGAPVAAVLEALARDKKRLSGAVPFVLVAAPGEVEVGCEVSAEDVRAALAELME
ncbi:MAG: bifunctional shikimate kinase/3-dehydroquinate synthase [Actinobacteria bacterium]|nr:MAG: bifunctional shikimate kinase/3-dehydroquinate synthase [Actinomycetota bacterium]